MEYIQGFLRCLQQMEKISKTIILIGVGLTLAVYLAAAITLAVYTAYYSDYTTGVCWFSDLAYLAKEILGACVVPVFLFEIVFIGKGLKTTDEVKK